MSVARRVFYHVLQLIIFRKEDTSIMRTFMQFMFLVLVSVGSIQTASLINESHFLHKRDTGEFIIEADPESDNIPIQPKHIPIEPKRKHDKLEGVLVKGVSDLTACSDDLNCQKVKEFRISSNDISHDCHEERLKISFNIKVNKQGEMTYVKHVAFLNMINQDPTVASVEQKVSHTCRLIKR